MSSRLAVAILLALPALAAAHPLEPSLLDVREADGGRVDVVWTTPARRVPGVTPRVVLPAGCVDASAPAVRDDPDRIVTRWSAACDAGLVGGRIGVTDLAEARSEALLRVQLRDGRLVQGVLTADAPELTVPERPRWVDVAASYLRLGVHHILSGPDHLLFVLGLLLLVGARAFLPAVTAFTLGHSVTLSLAVLGFVHVPTRVTEVLIAASVFVLAVELAREGVRPVSPLARRPWIMAAVFGLLHGLGFAGALADVGLPPGDIPLALGSFNVGIELGQIAVVAAALAAGWGFQALVAPSGRWRRAVPAYAIGSLAAFWMLQRAVLLLG